MARSDHRRRFGRTDVPEDEPSTAEIGRRLSEVLARAASITAFAIPERETDSVTIVVNDDLAIISEPDHDDHGHRDRDHVIVLDDSAETVGATSSPAAACR